MASLQTNNAEELEELLNAVKALIIPHVRKADGDSVNKSTAKASSSRPVLVDTKTPHELRDQLDLTLSDGGVGKAGLLDLVERTLQYSVNTWDQGFMDKLYASTNPVGVISELVLGILNTNVHVYQVSPVLTTIEKYTGRRLANLFGFNGPHAGGISQPGGSAGNASSIVIARNTLYPETKTQGLGNYRFTLFTSAHGHYSLEKAAQMYGFGSDLIISVPVDEAGRMIPSELDRLINESKQKGQTPFYVNATAGTTVMGSFDPFHAIADICQSHGLWMHVDGSWGGSVAFNPEIAKDRLDGVERASSVVMCAHKMLGVPVTCSFLVGKDMRQFWKALTLPAGYLFHNDSTGDDNFEVNDLADLTPQCGRKGDAFKLFLSWAYYGNDGLAAKIGNAFDRADQLMSILEKDQDFVLVSKRPLPCLQVCFYYAPGGEMVGTEETSRRTAAMAKAMIPKGWMIDFAPGAKGKFFRVVVNISTLPSSVIGLVEALKAVGKEHLASQ